MTICHQAANTTLAPLSAQDIKALAKADSVVFRHHRGATTIEAALTDGLSDSPRVFTAAEQRMFSDVGSIGRERQRVLYVKGNLSDLDHRASAFSMIHSAQYHPAWCTIVSLLRAGDELALVFAADAFSNDYTKAAGLHADRLTLEVRRGDKRLTFLLAVSVCKDNTARMVRA